MAQVPETFTVKIGDGVSTQFGFDFPYLHTSDVFVEVDEVPVGFTYTTGNTVTLNSAPADGAVVYIYRSTPAEQPAYDFQLGAPFLPAFIDENFRQLLYTVQEGLDRTAEVDRRAVRVPDNVGIPALPGSTVRAGKFLSFDAAGNPTAVVPREDTIDEVSRQLALEHLQSYVDSAESAEDRAAGAAVFAEQEADRAEVHAGRAEDAYAAIYNSGALQSASLYETIADGLSGTADDEYFWVYPNSLNSVDNLTLFKRVDATTEELRYVQYDLNAYMIEEGANWATGEL